jgi:hypothetical protein
VQENRKEQVDCGHAGYDLQLIARQAWLRNLYAGRTGHLRVRDAVGLEQKKSCPGREG